MESSWFFFQFDVEILDADDSDSDGNDDDDDDDDDDSRMRRQPLLNPLTLSCLRPPAKPWLLPAQILIVIYLHTLICMKWVRFLYVFLIAYF